MKPTEAIKKVKHDGVGFSYSQSAQVVDYLEGLEAQLKAQKEANGSLVEIIEEYERVEKEDMKFEDRVDLLEAQLAEIMTPTAKLLILRARVIELEAQLKAEQKDNRKLKSALGHADAALDDFGGVTELVEALSDLLDEQNGPPLIRHQSSWQAAVDKADKLIAEYRKDK
jgi:predicted RNase H-like nuclease (RuvC/YqgF family)